MWLTLVLTGKGHHVKASEYGGSDTHETLGIQPAPHTLLPYEQLRVLYATDPMDVGAIVPVAGQTVEEARPTE
jgi:hypothetical protein